MHAVGQQMQGQVFAHMDAERRKGFVHAPLQQGSGMQEQARGSHGIAVVGGLAREYSLKA